MPLMIGGTRIAKLYKGATPIARVYRGADKLFDAVAGETGPSYALVYAGAHTTAGTTITIPGLDFGAPHAARRIVVAVAWQQPASATRTLSEVAANGVALSVRQQVAGVPAPQNAAIFDGIVASGNTGLSVALTWDGGSMGAIVGVYRLQGASYQSGATASNAATSISTSAFSVADNGFVVAVTCRRASSDGAVFNSGVDQDAKVAGIQSNLTAMVGSRVYATGASVTVGTTTGGNSQQRRLAAASYQPD